MEGEAQARLRLPAEVLRVEHLYLLLALGAIGFVAGLLPVFPNDFWWHLRVGQLIAEQGRVPQTQLFSWSVPADAPFIYTAWLSEWLFYLLYRLGGVELIIFTRNVLVGATFALVGIEAWRRSGSWRLAGLAVALAGTLSLGNLIVRPQDWAWLPFTLFVVILCRYGAGQLRPAWLGALPALMAFWVNAHGSFVLGLVLVGCVAAGESIRRLLGDPAALSRRGIGWIYLSVIATAVATMLNPQGPSIFSGVAVLVGDPASQQLITEWQPPAPAGVVNGAFFGSVLLLLVGLAYARRRPTASDLLLICALLWLAWSGRRYVMWFGIAAMPLLAQCLAAPARDGPREPGGSTSMNWLIAGLILVPLLMVQPWFMRTLPLSPEYWEHLHESPAPPLLSTRTPLAATEFLRANPGGRLFNDMSYASYLIWALPEQPVFVDPRVAPYPLSQWQDYFEISNGRRAPELLAHYGADRVLLQLEDQAPLSRALAVSPGWRREYADRWSEVWRNDAGAGPAP